MNDNCSDYSDVLSIISLKWLYDKSEIVTGLPTTFFILCMSGNSTRQIRIGCTPQLVSVVTCLCMEPVTSDLVGCPQALGSPICLVDVADSLSFQQVLSGLTFGHWPAPMRNQAVCFWFPARLVGRWCNQPTAFYKSKLMGKYTNDKYACICAQLLACTLL